MFSQEDVIEKVNEGLLRVVQEEEKKIDEKLKKLDELDEDDIDAIREKRRQQLIKKQRKEQDLRQLGHGSYTELHDTKDFFNTCKKSALVVVHFFRPSTLRCEIFDKHLSILAQQYIDTKFLKINVEKNLYLCEKLGIIILPTLVIIKNGKTDCSVRGFDELGGTDDFSTNDLAYLLYTKGALKNYEGEEKFVDEEREMDMRKKALSTGLNTIRLNHVRGGRYNELSDADDDYSD